MPDGEVLCVLVDPPDFSISPVGVDGAGRPRRQVVLLVGVRWGYSQGGSRRKQDYLGFHGSTFTFPIIPASKWPGIRQP